MRRVLRLLRHPREEMAVIAAESTPVSRLLLRYIIPFSLLAPVAGMLGMTFFDARWNADLGYVVPPNDIVAAGVTTLLATIGSVFALAGIFAALGRLYGSSRDFGAALKVATYGALPVMIAGGVLVLPMLAIMGLAGLSWSLYLFWLGAGEILGVRGSQQSEFVGIAMVLLVVASTIAGAAVSALAAL